MRAATLLVTAAAAIALGATGCRSSRVATPPNATSSVHPTITAAGASGSNAASAAGTSATAPATTPAGGVDPNAPEVVEPGDIPDNQVFIAFVSSDGSYSIKVPEGWARTERNAAVSFTDKYNTVTVQSLTATAAPTVESVTASSLADVAADPTFTLIDVKPVARKAGRCVLARYEIASAANDVTGKKALLAVERYVFFRNGIEVVLTLSGAKGADNVDPWRIVSDSLTWK
jgi:hypothetical protein